MIEKEAIKVIEIAIAEVEWDYPLDYAVAFETAIKALEEIQQYREMDRTLLAEHLSVRLWLSRAAGKGGSYGAINRKRRMRELESERA